MPSVPPLRLRHLETPDDIHDLAFSFDVSDIDPPSVCQLAVNPADIETFEPDDPTYVHFDDYPWGLCAQVTREGFIRFAASHWQRVHPQMRRFTKDQIGNAVFLGAQGHPRAGLEFLVEASKGVCELEEEQYPDWELMV